MPELPDVELYLEALRPRVLGQPVQAIRIASPFVLRSVDPPIAAVVGRPVENLRRLGKRLVFCLTDDYYVVLHLMIAGRLWWDLTPSLPLSALRRGGRGVRPLAAFDFPTGTLLLTEAGKKHRASINLVRGARALVEHGRGGLEVLDASLADFRAVLRRENHTLKRALTDPQLFSGIGNAYSDEILHAARLSPLQLTSKLTEEQIARLFEATRATLSGWVERLRAQTADGWPEKVTAFREGMAVHGRYRQPCPVCGSPVQRIRYAENEVNYCVTCQTGGRLLADRALSRLLKEDWPRSLEDLEAHSPAATGRRAWHPTTASRSRRSRPGR
jgi:formamidopyrimidine-DNA glycosylase